VQRTATACVFSFGLLLALLGLLLRSLLGLLLLALLGLLLRWWLLDVGGRAGVHCGDPL